MEAKTTIQIAAPRMRTVEFSLIGTAPYVQHAFPAKVQAMLQEKMETGAQAKKGAKRAARDFDADVQAAMHIASEGWHGMPAAAFRKAMISACRLVGFRMTLAKLAIFIEADGFDRADGQPLVKIFGTPERMDAPVRNATGVIDIRARPMWREWTAKIRVRYDEDLFSVTDVTNLLSRVGMQVGIGEGRPDSRDSAGMGWGLFSIEG